MEEMRKKNEHVRLESRREFLSTQHCAQSLESHVSYDPKSTKGSCAAPTTSKWGYHWLDEPM